MSIVKKIYISLRGQAILLKVIDNLRLYDHDLRQFAVIYSNLPIPITLPNTIITYTVTAKKEGKRSIYIDIQITQL